VMSQRKTFGNHRCSRHWGRGESLSLVWHICRSLSAQGCDGISPYTSHNGVDEGDVDEGDVDEGDVDEGDVDEGDVDEGDVDEGDVALASNVFRCIFRQACKLVLQSR